MAKIEITDAIRAEHNYICKNKIDLIKRIRYVRTSGAAKDVMLYLIDCANSETFKCYPSVADIMAGTGLAEGTVKDAIAALKRVGLIVAKKPWKGAQPDYYLAFPKAIAAAQDGEKDEANRMEIQPSSRMEIQPIETDGNPANTIMEHNHGISTMERTVSAGERGAFGLSFGLGTPIGAPPLACSSEPSTVDIDGVEEGKTFNAYQAMKDGEITIYPIPADASELASTMKTIISQCGNLDSESLYDLRRKLMSGTLTDIDIVLARKVAA